MRAVILTVCAWAALLPLAAQAHAHLLRAVPADGSTIDSSPPQLRLIFGEAVTLTALSIQNTSAPAPMKLAGFPRQAAERFAIDLPQLAAGSYLVKWRALSDDSHLASGSIRFVLRAR